MELADTQAADDRLPPGTEVGEYRIKGHVGAGAMGDVYEALHPVIGKRVAIKVIKARLAGSADAQERFVREAKTANRVAHPNVVDVFALGQLPDGRLWLAMDFLDGEPLGKRLRSQGALPPAEVLRLLRPVCDALDAAHAQRVVHRDLKSDNIFLTRDGRVFVVDFGIAKVVAEATQASVADTGITAEGSWIGTPAYMAPEQWTAEGARAASDLYALGVVAYELLTGRQPYRGGTLPAIMEQHFRAEPPPLTQSQLPAGKRRAVWRTLARALAKRPEERFATAGEFLAALTEALEGRGAPRVPWAILAAAGAVAVAGGIALMVSRRDDAVTPRPAAAGLCVVSVVSRPTGARVERDGVSVGTAPVVLRAPDGAKVSLKLSRLGYHPAEVAFEARCPDLVKEIALAPERGFEGIWRIPTGGLRVFQRDEDGVAAYALTEVDGVPRFLRFFKIQPEAEDGLLRFAADEELIDPRAPDSPSCRTQLRAEYRYDATRDLLELRRQEADIAFRGGGCVIERAPRWTDFAPVARIAGADRLVRTVSSQGATGEVQQDLNNAAEKPEKPVIPKRTKPANKQAPLNNDPPPQQNKAPPPNAMPQPPAQQAEPAPNAPQLRK